MKSKLPVLQTRRLEVFHQYLTAKISSANNLESRNSLILFFLPEAPREAEFAKFSISFETDNPHRPTILTDRQTEELVVSSFESFLFNFRHNYLVNSCQLSQVKKSIVVDELLTAFLSLFLPLKA